MRVSEVWDSPEAQRAFGEKLMPRLQNAGLQLTGEPEVFDVHIYETF